MGWRKVEVEVEVEGVESEKAVDAGRNGLKELAKRGDDPDSNGRATRPRDCIVRL